MSTMDESVIERCNITKINMPKKWKVIMHNDDYTSMDFVVNILIEVFKKNKDEANMIMMSVHNTGKGVVGIYTKDIAFTKIKICNEKAKMERFPFKVTAEEE